MSKAKQLLKNLTFDYPWISIHSVEDGIQKLQGQQDNLEAIHIYLDPISPKTYPPKKKYFNITRVETLTKLDEWIFDNLINQEEYRGYLEKYLPLKDKLKYSDVDEFILNKHYRPKAIKTLSETRKSFNLCDWTSCWWKRGLRAKREIHALHSYFLFAKQEEKNKTLPFKI